MAEKPPEFTVTDRRKFTMEGERRDDETPQQPTQESAQPDTRAAHSDNVVSMPRRDPIPEAPEEKPQAEVVAAPPPGEEGEDSEEIRHLTEKESADQHAAYRESSQQLDTMLQQANPGMEASGPVTFDHVIQSIYLSAMIAMGAGTEPGQKPRIDIIGARQSIDMLGILQDKTRGNLNERETLLLQNALFELRMMFLEITNAIAHSAQQPPPPPGRGR